MSEKFQKENINKINLEDDLQNIKYEINNINEKINFQNNLEIEKLSEKCDKLNQKYDMEKNEKNIMEIELIKLKTKLDQINSDK